MEEIILYCGLGIFLVGLVQLTIIAFKVSFLQGILVLFVPLYVVYFIVFYWKVVSSEAKVFALGVVVLLIGGDVNGYINIPQPIKNAPEAIFDFVGRALQPGTYQRIDVDNSVFFL